MSNKDWDLNQKELFSGEDLRNIMSLLLAPGGCPWDRAQTHETIRKNLIEEAYETVDAIDSGNPDRIMDELGDVLLQVVFHAAIAEKNGTFTYDNVTDAISRKLISRHSHVFGSDSADSPEAVLSVWDKNKMLEKGHTSFSQTLQDVPEGIPALMRSEKLQKRAAKAGFDWPDAQGALEKIDEELKEINDELAEAGAALYEKVDAGSSPELYARVEDEVGDLLFAAVNYSRLLGIDPEVALNRANNKFVSRFSAMEEIAAAKGESLSEMSLVEMDEVWEIAKEAERRK
jgi:tetrapyrrole methylase family protein/MazG family protein